MSINVLTAILNDVEFAKTKELARVNRVDPLGITKLRIRGMWSIENPSKVFSYIYRPTNVKFEFVAVINNEKYYSFPIEDRTKIEKFVSSGLKISDVKIKTPDNPSILKDAKLINIIK